MKWSLRLGLAALLAAGPVLADYEQPPFEVKDPAITENFRNIFYQVDQFNAITRNGSVTCLDSPTFCVDATSHTVTFNGATLLTGATNYIQNTATLQSGATFFVSTGTVSAFTASTITANAATITALTTTALTATTVTASSVTATTRIIAPSGTAAAPGYTFSANLTTGIAYEAATAGLTFEIPSNFNYYWKSNGTVYLRLDTGSPPALWADGLATKTMDLGTATLAFDDVWADDFQNVADIPFFDYVKTPTGTVSDVDDLNVIQSIRPMRDKEGALLFNDNGHAYWDDTTLPDWLFTRDQKDPSRVARGEDGKPYIGLKALAGLAIGAVGQMAQKVESDRAANEARFAALEERLAALEAEVAILKAGK